MTLSRSAARKFQLDFTDASPASPPSRASSLSNSIFDQTVPSIERGTELVQEKEKKVIKSGRIYKGSRIEDIYTSDPFSPSPTFESFSQSTDSSLEDCFIVSSFLKSQIQHDPTSLSNLSTIPSHLEFETYFKLNNNTHEEEEVQVEVEVLDVEELVWIFEGLRKITIGLQDWVGKLQYECNKDSSQDDDDGGSCEEMKAGEWLYICVAHESTPLKPCSALSYISHVLDGTSSLFTSIKYFPSRITLQQGKDDGDDDGGGDKVRKLLETVSRRLYRCFSHTYFHHEKLFRELESESWLLRRFLKLNEKFQLIGKESLIIPELEWERQGIQVHFEEDEEENEEGGIRLIQ